MNEEYNYQNTDNKEDAFNMNYEYNVNYSTKPPVDDQGPISLGEWIVTIIIGAIPCIGLIVYIVWAFSNTINVSKKNYCRAYLIITAAMIVLYIILMVIFGISFMSGLDMSGAI